jgi:hypothetical protein
MFLDSRRFVAAIGSSLLTVGMLTTPAPAQMSHPMAFNAMQSVRPLNMMGLPSLGRPAFMAGFGMYPNLGINQSPMSPYGMPPIGHAMNYVPNPVMGYGSQPRQNGASSQPPGSGGGYASITSAPDAKSSQEPAGVTQLKSLRQFAGGMSWPRALYYFTSDGTLKELREDIDTKVEGLLARQDGHPVPKDMLEGLKGDVDKLRKRFIAQSYDVPMTSQQEADARRFLGKFQSALEQLSTTASVSTKPKER